MTVNEGIGISVPENIYLTQRVTFVWRGRQIYERERELTSWRVPY